MPNFFSSPLSKVIKEFATNSNSLYDAYEKLLINIDEIYESINNHEEKEIIKKILEYYTQRNESKMFDYNNISTEEYQKLSRNNIFNNIILHINLIELSNKIYDSIVSISKLDENNDDFNIAIKKIIFDNKDKIDNMFTKKTNILDKINKPVTPPQQNV